MAKDDMISIKRRPIRTDSIQTQKALLTAAAELLEEFGLEQISTNMIAKHAGVSPPALYHYYPNKYAILFELAHALLISQGNLISEWIEEGGLDWRTPREAIGKLDNLQSQLRTLADNERGSLWIMRGMRAIPKLREVRIVARNTVIDRLVAGILRIYPNVSRDALIVPVRLLHELVHLATELELDEPTLDTSLLRRNVAVAIHSIFDLVGPRDRD